MSTGVYGEYYYGNKVSDYGLEHGYVDYRTFAKAFDAVLANGLMEKTWELGYWEQVGGFVDNTDEIEELREKIDALVKEREQDRKEIPDREVMISEYEDEIENLERLQEEEIETMEIFQWYVVPDYAVDILAENNEIVFYNSELDLYLWGVTHFGTSWDYVLTDIKCNTGKYE